jgi:hypothetical protein
MAALISGGVALAPTIELDRRQEGLYGARSRSRRDKDRGGSEKGRSSNGSAFYECSGGVEGGQWEVATRRGEAGDRRRGWAAQGGRHRPRARTHDRVRQGRRVGPGYSFGDG